LVAQKFGRIFFHNFFEEYGQDISVILHNAAQPSHDWATKDPVTDFSVNALGTLNLLEAARKYCPLAVFIFMSTNKVYGDRPNTIPMAELETRWNLALTNAAEAETRLKNVVGQQAPLSQDQREKILSLGANLRLLWDDPQAPLYLKKRILRTAIREVVVRADDVSGKIELVIHWAGGVHTQLYAQKNRCGRNKNAASEETVELVRQLARGWPDKYIAQILVGHFCNPVFTCGNS